MYNTKSIRQQLLNKTLKKVFKMNLKDKSTTELKLMQESVNFELAQRKNEKEVPILRIFGLNQEDFTEQELSNEHVMTYICNQIEVALKQKNRTFSIKLLMVPESDTK